MSCFKYGAVCAITLATAIMAGCATTAKEPKLSNIDLQRSAMQSWNACIERNSNTQTLTAKQISTMIRHNCEGHKRDVLAVFPKHMSNQINQLLVVNTYERLEPNYAPVEITTEQTKFIRTLLR